MYFQYMICTVDKTENHKCSNHFSRNTEIYRFTGFHTKILKTTGIYREESFNR